MSKTLLPGLRLVQAGVLDDKVEPQPDQIADLYANAEHERLRQQSFNKSNDSKPSLLRDVLNISHVLTEGGAAIVDDSFNKCFTTASPDPWNWNLYLFPGWLLGVVFRHFVLFPLRFILLIILMILLLIAFFGAGLVMKPGQQRKAVELKLVQCLCGAFMMSWSAVVKYHGPKPVPAPGRVWVSNHTSMIDYALICSYSPCAVIMQLHQGWVAFLQTRVLNSLGCLWFNRTDLKDRHIVAARMKAHVNDPNSLPLLIFPEGTCVNNEYCVLFKRGAFDMGATVCPVAIKYNKIFVDAFWNSRRQSFGNHLLRLMFSWGVVCDVWFLPPQNKRDDETPDQFASRVQKMIADTAKLRIAPWDGYLKYYTLGQKNPGLIEKRRKVFADVLRHYLSGDPAQAAAPSEGSGYGGLSPEKKKDI